MLCDQNNRCKNLKIWITENIFKKEKPPAELKGRLIKAQGIILVCDKLSNQM